MLTTGATLVTNTLLAGARMQLPWLDWGWGWEMSSYLVSLLPKISFVLEMGLVRIVIFLPSWVNSMWLWNKIVLHRYLTAYVGYWVRGVPSKGQVWKALRVHKLLASAVTPVSMADGKEIIGKRNGWKWDFWITCVTLIPLMALHILICLTLTITLFGRWGNQGTESVNTTSKVISLESGTGKNEMRPWQSSFWLPASHHHAGLALIKIPCPSLQGLFS